MTADGTQISTLSIVIRDYEDNPILGLVENDFVITDYGDAVISNFQDLSNGEYSFDISNTTAETIILTITVDGVTIDDQPEITFNVIYFESFEDDDGGYTVSSGPSWEWGQPSTLVVASAADGVNCWATNLVGNYTNNALDILQTSIDLTGISSGTTLELSWMHAYVIEGNDWDQIRIKYKIDDGSWNLLWSSVGENLNPENPIIKPWYELYEDISDAAGHTLSLRWILNSDSLNTEEGYYIDKIQIVANS